MCGIKTFLWTLFAAAGLISCHVLCQELIVYCLFVSFHLLLLDFSQEVHCPMFCVDSTFIFEVLSQFMSNCFLDWPETWWCHSLWDSSGLINFWLHLNISLHFCYICPYFVDAVTPQPLHRFVSSLILWNCLGPYFDGILPKGPYPLCLHLAGRALLAGYPWFVQLHSHWPFWARHCHRTPKFLQKL